MTRRFAIVGFLLWLISQGSVVLAASSETKPVSYLPFLALLLEDSIAVLGSAETIETSSDNASCPRALFDSGGHAYVLWNQGPDYSLDSVWANRHTRTSGWGTAVTVESSPADIWGCPAVGADGSGNIVAVWSQSGVIMLNRYLAGSGWGTPETVGGSAGLSPSVAVDVNGTVFVVWEESRSIWARRYQADTGWGTASTIESYMPEAYAPSVVVDASGNATVVWAQQQTGLLFSAAANHYSAGSGWGAPVTISSGQEYVLNNQVVAAIDGNGHVTATWSQGPPVSGAIFTVRANRFVPGSGWGTPATLDTDFATSSNSPDVASAPGGATVVWGKYDRTIYAATYTTGNGWGVPRALASGGLSPDVAINSAGKVTVAWNHEFQVGGRWEYGTRAIQYTAGSGWGDVKLLAPNNSRSWGLTLATDSTGNFLAAWTEGPGPTADDVLSNLFR